MNTSGMNTFADAAGPFPSIGALPDFGWDDRVRARYATIHRPGLVPARVVRASVLGGGAAKVEQSAHGIEVTVPLAARNDIDTVVALQLDTPAEGLTPVR